MPATNFQECVLLLFALVIVHALADFPLQGEFLSKYKNRHCPPDPECGALPPSLWIYCLTAHALIHAGFLWIVTGSAFLAAAEVVIHWVTDFAKCEKWTNFHTDQFLHFFIRIVYVALLWSGIVT